jgi:uncharacterized paraquat-inducible protein A
MSVVLAAPAIQLYDASGNEARVAFEALIFCPECERWLAGLPVDPEHRVSPCPECSARLAEERERPAPPYLREVA